MTAPPKDEPDVAPRDDRPADRRPAQPDVHNPPMPMVPRPKAAIVATVALLTLWATATLFARPLMPTVLRVAEWIEVQGGFDVNDHAIVETDAAKGAR